jgi:hypothetical protein
MLPRPNGLCRAAVIAVANEPAVAFRAQQVRLLWKDHPAVRSELAVTQINKDQPRSQRFAPLASLVSLE